MGLDHKPQFHTQDPGLSKKIIPWLIVWITVFFSFVILDLIFQTMYAGKDVIKTFSAGSASFEIRLVRNGTFLAVTVIKYFGIMLNLIYALISFRKDHLLHIALAVTLLADTILTVNSVSVWGVIAFCFVQFFHSLRFIRKKPRFLFVQITICAVILLSSIPLKLPLISAVSIVYAWMLLENLLLAAHQRKTVFRDPASDPAMKAASTCALLGFGLFLLCDLNVVVSFSGKNGILPAALIPYANFFAWFFYYPGQVLLSNSSFVPKHSFSDCSDEPDKTADK